MRIESEIRDYYDQGREAGRLRDGPGLLEQIRTRELLTRLLPPAPAVVLDVGGGPGAYAVWLAERGYTVDLLDPVPRHIEEARTASSSSAAAADPLRSATVGDARDLPVADASVDAVLMLGPLYHLTEAGDRALSLREAHRVLRPGGVLLAVGISRFASTIDGIGASYLASEEFAQIVAEDVATGHHRNPDNVPGWFTTAYFHRPEELVAEVAAAGFDADGPFAIEGPSGAAAAMAELLDGGAAQERALAAIRRIEREPSLLGASAHLMVLGRAD
ncbi:class I SAM-dependent methyltransferase [Occultella aeris]|uniref:Demethylrebeccamycin-D-glucose O-methyltransferase n=1 Tax=Occultella aeris TaxID=2761496 RepID=A0A7M4DQ30_9MICO|nr:class I SAM-dependent methyltransferase [Occultella aeris]VZO39574.1 Demethylrebeccamycin-D-glucose O-methyltransferase [Occultella aeris]